MMLCVFSLMLQHQMLEPGCHFLEDPECPRRDRATGTGVHPSERASSLCPAPNTETEPLLTWKKAQDTIPWSIILLLGGGFAMAKGCEVRTAGGLQARGGVGGPRPQLLAQHKHQ